MFGVLGANLTYVFNPDVPSAPFPMGTNSLYGTPAAPIAGHWVPGPVLEYSRWYPTATLTSRLQRVQGFHPNDGEVILVAGGSLIINSPNTDSTWNSYEALRITGPSSFGLHGLQSDSTPTSLGAPGSPGVAQYTWTGPGTTGPLPNVEVDWLHEYPRLHQLSNGRVFFSGYAPHASSLDHETPGSWIKAPAQPVPTVPPTFSSNWNEVRHDGSTVLLPSVNGVNDVVMRVGGGDGSPGQLSPNVNTTPTTEVSVGGSFWTPTPPLPNPVMSGAPNGGRMFGNLVPLPTGALLLVGGENLLSGAKVSMTNPLIYANGAWHVDVSNGFYPVQRNYHSTAVLLPDGCVLIGGSNDRQVDYEIYSPYYKLLPANQTPINVLFQSPAPVVDTITGAFELNYGIKYGMICSIGDPNISVARVALTAPGAMTHHSDMHARHVHLGVELESPTSFTIMAPANDNLAPRGVYMLWVVTDSNTVSDAIWVVLR